MELIEDYDGVATRSPSLRPLSATTKHGTPADIERSGSSNSNKSFKKRCPDEDSWTSVDRQELDHATSYVSESMYLVMENPVSSLHVGEVVYFKVHALCDKSASGLVGVNSVAVASSSESKHGTLFLTNYRLLFLSFERGGGEVQELVEVQLNNVAELAEFRVNANSKTGMASQLEISCKNFEIVKFNFPCDSTSGEIYVRINQVLTTKQPQVAYACTDISVLPDLAGWAVYDQQSEFTRLGFKAPRSTSQMSGFRVTHINSNYKMSPTYPSSFIVPASVSDGELRKISHFRARGRVPAVTYRHRNDAIIARCAQPLVGLRRKRCSSDEAYMTALRRESSGKLLFVDCRSQTSAYGNIALGGGFEVLDYYRETNIVFMGIENIHSMRDSIRKLFDLIKNEVRGNERSNWWSCLESTRWLEHVRSVLVSCSVCVTKLTEEGTSLLIHCSDGWDRTAQLVALTKLCVDPFYRSIKGFQILIEQEWCAFGHQFRARSGHSHDRSNYWEDEHTSPVFMQFIDAVWQLMRQFPCSFEFNERYLIALLDETYGKRSGTFLHDCEESRIGSMTLTRCISAWTLLESHPQTTDFLNPFYIVPFEGEAYTDRSPVVLQFKWHTSSLAIWTAFYLRSLESNDSRDAWAKELQVTQRELQDQLSTAHQKLQTQVETNSELHTELEALRKESARLRMALQGQVFTDDASGMLVHEQEEDDDGVLLSVTPVNDAGSSSAWPYPPNSAQTSGAVDGRNGRVLSNGKPNSFIGASISSGFEIFHSYFDPVLNQAPSSKKSPSRRHSHVAVSDSSLHSSSSRSSSGSVKSVAPTSRTSTTGPGGCSGPSMFAASASQQSPKTVEEMVQ
ncbi:Myotubularin-like protein [Globisporangium polare]